jgi:hypothetical protein
MVAPPKGTKHPSSKAIPPFTQRERDTIAEFLQSKSVAELQNLVVALAGQYREVKAAVVVVKPSFNANAVPFNPKGFEGTNHAPPRELPPQKHVDVVRRSQSDPFPMFGHDVAPPSFDDGLIRDFGRQLSSGFAGEDAPGCQDPDQQAKLLEILTRIQSST